MDIKKWVSEYQCPGCSCGNNPESGCFEQLGSICTKHVPGTMMFPGGTIYLGMPTGFNRIGKIESSACRLFLFSSAEEFVSLWNGYDKFNVPVWKHLNEHGHTLVRGLSPRNNMPFLHVHLYDCMKDVNCMEVSQEMVDSMD